MTDVMDDPFAVDTDENDPFATKDDVKSNGVFVPRPPIDVIAERPIVLVPRSFDKEAKVSEYLRREFNLPETREEWTIDLVILGTEPMEYEYRSKVQGTEDEFETKTMRIEEFPFVVPNFRVTWANIIGSLNKLSASPRPFGVGRIRGGYSAADMRKGKTFEQFAEELAAWEAKVQKNPKSAGDRPKPKWHFVIEDDNPETMALARAWWAKARAEGFRVN